MYGDVENLLAPTSCVFNIGLEKLKSALDYFYPSAEDIAGGRRSAMPCLHEELLAAL